MSNINTLDYQVRYILERKPDTRNSDVTLMIEVWRRFYSKFLIEPPMGAASVPLEHLYELPREDNIKRVRAKIQNVEKLFVPTDPKIAEKRGWKIEEWRQYLGYSQASMF